MSFFNVTNRPYPSLSRKSYPTTLGELQRLDGFAEDGSAVFQGFLLDRLERQRDGAHRALAAHEMRQRSSRPFQSPRCQFS